MGIEFASGTSVQFELAKPMSQKDLSRAIVEEASPIAKCIAEPERGDGRERREDV